MWYHQKIGAEKCPIVDTWWQTETGAIMISPLPGVTLTKPGSATLPLPWVDADIVDEAGKPVTGQNGGYLVVRKPWPSMLRTIYGDHQRFQDVYWSKFEGLYFAGDSAHRDKDGYFWIMGRVDDVINVSGHRLGTMEVESALASHPSIAEAAVVGMPHEIKGQGICAYVIAKEEPTDQEAFRRTLKEHVAHEIGAIAKPDIIILTDALPKTRSGKIMRRLLKDLAAGRDTSGDTSTLEDPSIIEKLKQGRGIQ
jgi:acetyl-CoA synthetase